MEGAEEEFEPATFTLADLAPASSRALNRTNAHSNNSPTLSASRPPPSASKQTSLPVTAPAKQIATRLPPQSPAAQPVLGRRPKTTAELVEELERLRRKRAHNHSPNPSPSPSPAIATPSPALSAPANSHIPPAQSDPRSRPIAKVILPGVLQGSIRVRDVSPSPALPPTTPSPALSTQSDRIPTLSSNGSESLSQPSNNKRHRKAHFEPTITNETTTSASAPLDRASTVPRVDPVRELASLFPPRMPRTISEPIQWDSLEYRAPGCSILAPWDLGASESLLSAEEAESLDSAAFANELFTRQPTRAGEELVTEAPSERRSSCVEGVASNAQVARDVSGEPDGEASGRGGPRRWEECFVVQCGSEPMCVMPYVDLELDLVPPRPARDEDLKKVNLVDEVQSAGMETAPS